MENKELIKYLESKENKIAEIIESCLGWTNGWYTENYTDYTKDTANKIIKHLKISIKSKYSPKA